MVGLTCFNLYTAGEDHVFFCCTRFCIYFKSNVTLNLLLITWAWTYTAQWSLPQRHSTSTTSTRLAQLTTRHDPQHTTTSDDICTWRRGGDWMTFFELLIKHVVVGCNLLEMMIDWSSDFSKNLLVQETILGTVANSWFNIFCSVLSI